MISAGTDRPGAIVACRSIVQIQCGTEYSNRFPLIATLIIERR